MANGSHLEAQQGADLVLRQPNENFNAISDVSNTTSRMTPGEYNQLLQSSNNVCSADLPDVQLVGNDSAKLSLPPNVCEIVGNYTVSTNEKGEPETITDKGGNVFQKLPDGKWSMTSPDGLVENNRAENVILDDKGNFSYDVNHTHVIRQADGTTINEDKENHSRVVFGTNGAITETSAGEGYTRKFHYDSNHHLDQIDGRLGHWDRSQDAQGKSVWTNKDNGQVWKGEFDLMPDGSLGFTSRNGTTWVFDASGHDRKVST